MGIRKDFVGLELWADINTGGRGPGLSRNSHEKGFDVLIERELRRTQRREPEKLRPSYPALKAMPCPRPSGKRRGGALLVLALAGRILERLAGRRSAAAREWWRSGLVVRRARSSGEGTGPAKGWAVWLGGRWEEGSTMAVPQDRRGDLGADGLIQCCLTDRTKTHMRQEGRQMYAHKIISKSLE